MSRLEKSIERRYKRQRKKFILKLLFIATMTALTSVCLIIVYDNANIMLGNSTFIEDSTNLLKTLGIYIKNQMSSFK